MGLRPTEGNENQIDWRRLCQAWNGAGRLRSGSIEAVPESGLECVF